MLPILIDLKVFSIKSYGLILAIGFLLAVHMIERDAEKRGIDRTHIARLAAWVLLLGIAGARITYILMFADKQEMSGFMDYIAVWRGGLVFQGGLIPAVLFCLWYCWRHKIHPLVLGDTIIPWLPLGHGIGRLGCFMAGCCYGRVCHLPWAVRFPRYPHNLDTEPLGCFVYLDHYQQFPEVRDQLWSLPVHPTQLYAAVSLIALCGVLLFLRRHWRPFLGVTMTLYLILYGIIRFVLEMFRADHNPSHWISAITDQQFYSLVSVVLGIVLFLIFRKLPAAQIQPDKDENA